MDKQTSNQDPAAAREERLRESREAWQAKIAKRQAKLAELAVKAHDLALAEMTRTPPPTQ